MSAVLCTASAFCVSRLLRFELAKLKGENKLTDLLLISIDFFQLNTLVWSAQYSAVTPSHYEELAVHTSNWELIYTPLSFTERKALLQHKNLSVQLAGCLGLLDAVLFPHPDVPVPSDFSLKNITELLKERKR